ncbi:MULTISPECIES: bifunctional copper resistance protein CopD/cytochrome c oxidase assembly protein [Streptomyces]|uniref:bifunctional copper resistance protein CopD/cytochrome c oxidase assembly protein n=1 Tax=Streptomyces TaxID=1883 RepID=UPI00224E12BA|nr:bifunctional copper resistance protein CopD/cytochrome c oxidase assembly protein [Streptomyces virginiae]MCX5275319.1 bifunctional copper resistance protein CopD/cytochrome c oxidase assembly protein [Streptomyces virginiae]
MTDLARGGAGRRLPLIIVASTVLAVGVTVVAMWAAGSTAQRVPGIEDAGPLTSWGLPLSRILVDAASVGTVGALLLAGVLLPGGRDLGAARMRYVAWAAVAAGLWALASAALLVFTLSDLFARPVDEVLDPAMVADFALSSAQGRSYAAMAAAGLILATLCAGVTTVRWARAALVLAVAAVLPPAFTGHSAASANHDAAVTSLALHVAGVAAWVGGLLFVLVAALGRTEGAAVAARRFSTLAGGAFLAVAASGLVNALVRLPLSGAWFTTSYGRMVLIKSVALLLLGAVGWWHRRRTLPALADGARRPFVRLAAGELLVMAAAMGLAVALSRTPAPGRGSGSPSPAEELLGFPMPPPLGDFPWTPLFTQWHFDPVFAFGTGAAAALYLVGVFRLRARGDHWPIGRTVSWMLGLTVTVAATMSGLAVYGKVMFSVHMGQHMILAMTVPILLVLGAPATLALRTLPKAGKDEAAGPREALMWLLHSRYVKIISHPAVAGVLFIGSAFAVYYTSWFERLMGSHLGHMAMLIHFLAVGLLFFWVIIGVDPGPRRPPHLGRLFVLMLTMPFHSWFSISVMSSTGIIGAGWWEAVGRTWGPDLAQDQYNGGAIAWATGDIPVLITTIILAAQWVRSDHREARRVDRQIDRGDAGDPLAAYNAYLAGLHARDRRLQQAAKPAAREAGPASAQDHT